MTSSRPVTSDGSPTGDDHSAAALEGLLTRLAAQAGEDVPDPRLVQTAVATIDAVEDPTRRAGALELLAYHGMRADPARFAHLVDQLDPEPRFGEDGLPADGVAPGSRVHGLLARGARRALEGDLDAAAALGAAAHRLAATADVHTVVRLRAAANAGVWGGDLRAHRERARGVLADAVDRARATGHDAMVPMLLAIRANAVWADGDLEGSAAGYREAGAVAEELDLPRWLAESHCGLTHIHADAGDPVRAREHLDACTAAGDRYRARARAGGGVGGAGRQWVSTTTLRARIAFAEADDEAAIAAWRAEVVDPRAPGMARQVSAMDMTVAALAFGDRASVLEAADELRGTDGRGLPTRLVRPLVVGAADGDLAAVVEAAGSASDGPFYAVGKAAEIAGLLARDYGDADSAISWLTTAARTWRDAGAHGLAARTSSWLRELGVRSRGDANDRPTSGWASLTDAELRVVEQVTAGLLYREVAERLHLSRRTVETHVAAATRKVGVRTRGELAAAWFRDGPGADT